MEGQGSKGTGDRNNQVLGIETEEERREAKEGFSPRCFARPFLI